MVIKTARLPADVRRRLATVGSLAARIDGLEALWLFGSYARGDVTPLSDLDLAYLAAPGGDAAARDVAIYRALSRHLGTDELTLLDLAGAPAAVAYRVLQEGRLLFCRSPEAVADLTERVLRLRPEAARLQAEQLRSEEEAAVEIDREKVGRTATWTS